MTKKDKILEIFNKAEWVNDTKYLHSHNFHDAGLDSCIEYGERYNDIIYAIRIFRKLGYKAFVGRYCVYVSKIKGYEKDRT